MRSAGKPLPGVEIAIIDDDGNALPPRRGRRDRDALGANMNGYWNLPEATATTIDADGWLRTGDAGYLDEDGYLFIHDRIKDMIISGGENIYPAEVENAIYGHPDVAEVAVIGVPDDKWGEAVKAIVVLKPGEKRRIATSSPSPASASPATRRRRRRLHRRAAAQRVGQDPAARICASPIGRAKTGG